MNLLLRNTLWLWVAMLNPLRSYPSLPRVRALSTAAVTLTCLAASLAHAEASSTLVVPRTQNPYIPALATLYKQGRYAEALSRLEKALERKDNGTQELIWLKLVQGVLQAELAQGEALESFKQALALNKEAQLPVQNASRRLRKLFEQARKTLGLPADKEMLAEEMKQSARAPGVAASGPPPRRYGLSVSVRGELDTLGVVPYLTPDESLDALWLGLRSSVTPAVSLGYTQQKLGGVLTVLVQPSPGLRAEGQYHPFTLGWVRPYARLGATAFFAELNAQGDTTFFGGVSGRGALGVDVQWNSRMYVFADVTYEHFFTGEGRYRPQSALLSIGVGLFP